MTPTTRADPKTTAARSRPDVCFLCLMLLVPLPSEGRAQAAPESTIAAQKDLRIRAEGESLVVESPRFTATFEGARLTSVVSRAGGTEFCRKEDSRFPLELCYLSGDTLKEDKHQRVTVKPLSELAARVLISGNDSDRELFVRLDSTSGDLCVTPSGRSDRATGEGRALPNVILIVADDLGWTDLACFGSDLHETPHLDRLARDGMRFTAAYAAAPVCTPTRASIHTGKCPARLNMTIWLEASKKRQEDRKLIPPATVTNLPHAEVTVAEVLRPAGYFTAHVGKWHLGEASHYPETQGFDVNIGGTFWGAPATYFHPYRSPASRNEELRYVPHLEWGAEGEYLTDRLTTEAIAIVQRSAGRPFFLHLGHHAVHTPIEGKAALVARYRAKLEPSGADGGTRRHRNPDYAAMVQSLDENVGRLLASLDGLGLAERTVVIFTSDNGGYVNEYGGVPVTVNEPLRSGKGSLYEGGIRVPLIVRWPGVAPAGSVCEEPVISSDLYPTILEVAGQEGDRKHNEGVDGLSLVPLLKDPKARLKRDALFWHYPHYYPTTTPVSAIRSGDWKLLEYFEDDHVELYNLREDLGERKDLSASLPEVAGRLRERLRAWRESVGAQLPARAAAAPP